MELGSPGFILDVELPTDGTFSRQLPPDFNGFMYVLEGEASLGSNPRLAARSQIAVLGPGGAVVVDARPGTRFMLMAGKPLWREACLQRAVGGLRATAPDNSTSIASRRHPLGARWTEIPKGRRAAQSSVLPPN